MHPNTHDPVRPKKNVGVNSDLTSKWQEVSDNERDKLERQDQIQSRIV